jgi:F-type H+-transporting ATPase subunit gamma
MFTRSLNALNKLHSLNSITKRSFAVNEKSLKMRIKSVGSIAKITKAMKMVSSSKMKADLARLQQGKFFGHETINKIFLSDVYIQRKNQNQGSGSRVLLVPITSDKGLCGGTNSGIVREVKSIMGKISNRNQCGIYCVGDKGSVALTRAYSDILKRSIHDMVIPINYSTVSAIAHDIGEYSKNFDKVVLIYNKYKSAISAEVTKIEMMPRHKFLDLMSFSKGYNQKLPDKASSNPALYDLYVSSNLYQAVLNNIASEQSARMNAMENASKNAKEVVQKLILQYNKARQARITMELVEIISGASAV